MCHTTVLVISLQFLDINHNYDCKLYALFVVFLSARDSTLGLTHAKQTCSPFTPILLVFPHVTHTSLELTILLPQLQE